MTCPRTIRLSLVSYGENLCWYYRYVLLKILFLILIFSLRFMLMTAVSYRNVPGRRPNSFWKKKKRTSLTSHFLTPNSDASLVKTQQQPMIFPLSDVKLSEKPRAHFACWLSRSCGFFVNGHREADLRIPRAPASQLEEYRRQWRGMCVPLCLSQPWPQVRK